MPVMMQLGSKPEDTKEFDDAAKKELVDDLRQAVIDYRAASHHERDDDYTTNTLNMWISRFGGKRVTHI